MYNLKFSYKINGAEYVLGSYQSLSWSRNSSNFIEARSSFVVHMNPNLSNPKPDESSPHPHVLFL
jgi:hypothetical protein